MSGKKKNNQSIAVFIIGGVILLAGGFFLGRAFSTKKTVEPLATETVLEPEPTSEPTDILEPEVVEEITTVDDPLAEYPNVEYIGSLGRDDNDTRILVSKLIEKENVNLEEILSVCCDDFDGSGESEAFIFEGVMNDGEEAFVEGTCWFVGNDSISKLSESSTGLWGNTGRFIDCKKRKFFVLDEYYATGYSSCVYSIADGKPYTEAVFGCGYFKEADNGSFRVVTSMYDGMYDKEMQMSIGHTWKEYYCYYNEDDDSIYEYGGKELDVEELNHICGYQISEEITRLNGVILSAFERENGLININYIIDDGTCISFMNATFDKDKNAFLEGWGDGNTDFEKSNQDGIYMESYTSAEKTYPAKGDYAKTRNITLNVYGASQGAALDYMDIIYGSEYDEDMGEGSCYEQKAFIIDDKTKMSDMDTAVFVGRTEDMSAFEWISSLIKATEDDIVNGQCITGVFELEVTGSHVDKIIGQYWWD